MSKIWLQDHPMKREVLQILKRHFSDSIANKFVFMFEAELYDSPNIHNQLKDDRLIMEVRYKTDREETEYVCDIFSTMTKSQAEYKLLRYITDLFKTGKIGKDWHEVKGKIVSGDITSGKYETHELQDDQTSRNK